MNGSYDLHCINSATQVEHEVNNSSEEDARPGEVEPTTAVIDRKMQRRFLILRTLKITYIIISVIAILGAVLLIGVSAVGAIVFRSYTTDSGSRVASMIVAATFAAVGVALAAYGNATIIRNKTGALHRISVAYVVTACALLLLAVFAVHMSPQGEEAVALALSESFRLSRQHSPRHTRQWQQTQFELDCCGLHGPEDYQHGTSSKFPPEVSSSCCAGYDPSLSDLLQQDMLKTCRLQNTFYRAGCQENVARALTDASGLVYLLCVVVVAFFMVLGAYGIPLSRLIRNWRKSDAKQGTMDAADVTKA